MRDYDVRRIPLGSKLLVKYKKTNVCGFLKGFDETMKPVVHRYDQAKGEWLKPVAVSPDSIISVLRKANA